MCLVPCFSSIASMDICFTNAQHQIFYTKGKMQNSFLKKKQCTATCEFIIGEKREYLLYDQGPSPPQIYKHFFKVFFFYGLFIFFPKRMLTWFGTWPGIKTAWWIARQTKQLSPSQTLFNYVQGCHSRNIKEEITSENKIWPFFTTFMH